MSDLEELIQDDEPPTVAGVIQLLDACSEDLGRLMLTGELRQSYPLRSLVYRLEQARTIARRVYDNMNTIFNSTNDTK